MGRINSALAARILLSRYFYGELSRPNHCMGVYMRAKEVISSNQLFNLEEDLVDAAAIHDIGYSPKLFVTGFHPIDGYLEAQKLGFNEDVCKAVLYHSYAEDLCPPHLDHYYKGLTDRQKQLVELLNICDATIQPNGNSCNISYRLEDIVSRYGENHLNTKVFRSNYEELVNLCGKYNVKSME